MFSERELETINLAKKKIKYAKFPLVMSITVLVILAVAMYTGKVGGETFAYIAIGLVVLSIAQPQLGAGSKYADLVNLLESKSKSKI